MGDGELEDVVRSKQSAPWIDEWKVNTGTERAVEGNGRSRKGSDMAPHLGLSHAGRQPRTEGHAIRGD